MKKFICILLFFVMLGSLSFYILSRSDTVGTTTPSTLRTFINNQEITSYIKDGATFVSCHALKDYGFTVETDRSAHKMILYPDAQKELSPGRVRDTSKNTFSIYESTWQVVINGEEAPSYQINHDVCIAVSALKPFGEVDFISAEQKVVFRFSTSFQDEPIKGAAHIDAETAKAWAENKGAAQLFIDAADLYWKYGKATGLRPEVLYAQAAKETAYGKYTGNVVPEQHNFAGIKTVTASGDTTYDHESFATAEDGVRAHFNHMAAYVGAKPVGEVHGRYHVVLSTAWAGSIRTVSELGGRWAPDKDYGNSIIHDYLYPMIQTKK
ncbi:MAG: glucosaminidase domain-containing protein [Clostridia bacterium]|nr:glucosaminidase domain-containing protein [Clostridia bacterium]